MKILGAVFSKRALSLTIIHIILVAGWPDRFSNGPGSIRVTLDTRKTFRFTVSDFASFDDRDSRYTYPRCRVSSFKKNLVDLPFRI